jgi:hypothetical protein
MLIRIFPKGSNNFVLCVEVLTARRKSIHQKNNNEKIWKEETILLTIIISK